MGKVPHRKRLTRRKDRDPRKRKKPPDTNPVETHQQDANALDIQETKQISPMLCETDIKHSNVDPTVHDPVPLTPLVEKLKQHLQRIRFENSSRSVNKTHVSL